MPPHDGLNSEGLTSEDTSSELPRERLLLRRHQLGDPEAFAEFMTLHRKQVYTYLIRCGVQSQHLDDLFQEIFLLVHNNAGSYDPNRPPAPWVYTITANAVRSHFRKVKVRSIVQANGSDLGEENPAPAEHAADLMTTANETAHWLESEIARLPLAQREVVTLCCMRDLSQQDAATILGMPLNTVKTHLRRARATLAGALARRNQNIRREASL